MLKNKTDIFINTIEGINQIAINIAAVFMGIAIFYIFLDVVIRLLPGRVPTLYSVEICGYFLMYFAFLSYSYTDQKGFQIKLEILNMFVKNQKIKSNVQLINFVINFFVTFFLFTASLIWVIKTYKMGVTSYTELRIPLYIPRASMPIGFLLLSFGSIRKIILWFTHIEKLKKEEGLEELPKI